MAQGQSLHILSLSLHANQVHRALSPYTTFDPPNRDLCVHVCVSKRLLSIFVYNCLLSKCLIAGNRTRHVCPSLTRQVGAADVAD